MTTREQAIEANRLRNKLRKMIMADERISRAGVRLAEYLLEKANNNRGYAWPSYLTIAADLGLSKQGILKALKPLETCGYFAVKRVEKPGRGHTNEYIPQLPVAKERVNGSIGKGSTGVAHTLVYSLQESTSEEDRDSLSSSIPFGDTPGALRSRKSATGNAEEVGSKDPEKTGDGNEGSISSLGPILPPRVQEVIGSLDQVRSWSEFSRTVLDDVGVRCEFYTSAATIKNISIPDFETAIEKFGDFYTESNRPWYGIEIACIRLLKWLNNEEQRGSSWGKEYDEDCYEDDSQPGERTPHPKSPPASFSRPQNGVYHIKSKTEPRSGSNIRVARKDNSTVTVVVGEVLGRKDDGYWHCTIQKKKKRS